MENNQITEQATDQPPTNFWTPDIIEDFLSWYPPDRRPPLCESWLYAECLREWQETPPNERAGNMYIHVVLMEVRMTFRMNG